MNTVYLMCLVHFLYFPDHEIIGMEHIPEGPGILIYYHGTVSIDYLYFMCKLYTQKGRLCVSVSDKALFYIPGTVLLTLNLYLEYCFNFEGL